uniref:Reverse transcriptase Ty1/copia-type domain-containing protein n=1 Tax=Nicotiana tabacum TaxID=4097 RepID=A0A1S4AEC9_TOBAC|nr:PREDICTED: uncharacterized protein LOC107796709 [Nicotiana tabacum]
MKKRDILERFQSHPKFSAMECLLGEKKKTLGYRNKLNEDGKVVRNKAKLVAQGYSQQEGVDYDETFAPVTRLESIRILLAYASFKRFRLFHMDVKSTFLNGFIDEELEGFSDADLAGDKEYRKSTSGTFQLLGKALISWNGDPDLVEKLTAIDNKLTIINNLFVATQSTIGDIHAISKEIGSDVSKMRVKILKHVENAFKAFKEVHNKIDGVIVLANAIFEHLKEAIGNTLTYFLHR